MHEINRRSPYWLSPGIDVPTRDEFLLLLSRRTLRGFYVDRDTGESAFVPTAEFMRESPLWRIDVLDDIADGLQRTRTHALVAFFRECQAKNHDVQMARQLAAFRGMCQRIGIELPDDLEALLVLDQQFRRSAMWGSTGQATK
ncbi:MAG: hypothetical protein MK097_03565 [Dechloromonas sp.]|nr:hypothetical protein [Dechloromonas sp.]